MRWVVIVGLAAAAVAGVLYYRPALVPALLPHATPHEAYRRGLERAGLAETALARDWKGAAERALSNPAPVELPEDATLSFPADRTEAAGYRMRLRRGRVLHVEATSAGTTGRVFIDLYLVVDDKPPRHVASAAEAATRFEREIATDGDYILRVQPELLRSVTVRISQGTRPSLTFPVSGRDSSAVRSFFRDPRDGGRREHHGVDIFAPQGTPVVAAAGGVVTSVATTRLGGNVVWVWDARRRQAQYYAHLSEQAVRPGTIVGAGEVVGYVGNTGNARTTPPHLHFGIYGLAEGPIDPLPFVQGGKGPAVSPPPGARSSRDTRAPAAAGNAESADQ